MKGYLAHAASKRILEPWCSITLMGRTDAYWRILFSDRCKLDIAYLMRTAPCWVSLSRQHNFAHEHLMSPWSGALFTLVKVAECRHKQCEAKSNHFLRSLSFATCRLVPRFTYITIYFLHPLLGLRTKKHKSSILEVVLTEPCTGIIGDYLIL